MVTSTIAGPTALAQFVTMQLICAAVGAVTRENGRVAHYQVTLKIGFRLEESED